MAVCRWICIYAAYINSKKTLAEGRRVPKHKVWADDEFVVAMMSIHSDGSVQKLVHILMTDIGMWKSNGFTSLVVSLTTEHWLPVLALALPATGAPAPPHLGLALLHQFNGSFHQSSSFIVMLKFLSFLLDFVNVHAVSPGSKSWRRHCNIGGVRMVSSKLF